MSPTSKEYTKSFVSNFQQSPIKGERPPDKIANFRAKSKRRGPPESPSPKKNPFSKDKYLQESLSPTKGQPTHSPPRPRVLCV